MAERWLRVGILAVRLSLSFEKVTAGKSQFPGAVLTRLLLIFTLSEDLLLRTGIRIFLWRPALHEHADGPANNNDHDDDEN